MDNYFHLVFLFLFAFFYCDNFRVTVLESAMIAGAIAGSLSSGPLFRIDEKYCYFIPFILCFAIVFLVTIFSYFFVPERVRNEVSIILLLYYKIFKCTCVLFSFFLCFAGQKEIFSCF